MYLYRLGCRVLEPCFPTIHPNMDGRRAPRFPKRVFHVARNAIFMVPDTCFHGSRNAPRFPKRVFHVARNAIFMVPDTRFHGSRNALSWFPKRAFMVPETRFHGSRNDLSWFPKCVHGSRNDLHGSRNGFHGSRNAFMVPETWFPNRRAPVNLSPTQLDSTWADLPGGLRTRSGGFRKLEVPLKGSVGCMGL